MPRKDPSVITVNGTKYASIRQSSFAEGLDYRKVWARLKEGKSIVEAFRKSDLKRTGLSKNLKVDGKKFASRQEAADYINSFYER